MKKLVKFVPLVIMLATLGGCYFSCDPMSGSSQYSECENRIRHHYHFKCVPLLSQLQLSIFTGPTQKSKLDLSTVRQNSKTVVFLRYTLLLERYFSL